MKLRGYCTLLFFLSSTNSWSGDSVAINTAKQDLASRLQVPLKQIAIVAQTEKTWPDGSLGCPRRGMKYKQVISNGSQLVLAVAGQHYFYHSGADNAYFYCATPAKNSGAPVDAPITHRTD